MTEWNIHIQRQSTSEYWMLEEKSVENVVFIQGRLNSTGGPWASTRLFIELA